MNSCDKKNVEFNDYFHSKRGNEHSTTSLHMVNGIQYTIHIKWPANWMRCKNRIKNESRIGTHAPSTFESELCIVNGLTCWKLNNTYNYSCGQLDVETVQLRDCTALFWTVAKSTSGINGSIGVTRIFKWSHIPCFYRHVLFLCLNLKYFLQK